MTNEERTQLCNDAKRLLDTLYPTSPEIEEMLERLIQALHQANRDVVELNARLYLAKEHNIALREEIHNGPYPTREQVGFAIMEAVRYGGNTLTEKGQTKVWDNVQVALGMKEKK